MIGSKQKACSCPVAVNDSLETRCFKRVAVDKLFKTYDEQLQILRNRGLLIPEDSRAKKSLEKNNYYNVINGYKDLFLDNSMSLPGHECFKPGTKFTEIAALFEFDRELRIVFLKQILRAENNLKSEIAYAFSKTHGHDNFLTLRNFDLIAGDRKRLKDVVDLLKFIHSDIAQQVGKNEAISHYMTQYGYVPLWVLVNIFSFGRMSKFYSLMKQRERQAVAKSYRISDNELGIMLKLLTHYRNKCAHDERLYNFRTRNAELMTNYYHGKLGIPVKNSKPTQGKNDAFAVVIALKILLEPAYFGQLVEDLRRSITKLGSLLLVINTGDVLTAMGFPHNWEDILAL